MNPDRRLVVVPFVGPDRRKRKMTTTVEIEAKVDAHIDVCAVRYQGLDEQIRGVNARLKRLEQTLITAGGGIILLLLGIVFKVH